MRPYRIRAVWVDLDHVLAVVAEPQLTMASLEARAIDSTALPQYVIEFTLAFVDTPKRVWLGLISKAQARAEIDAFIEAWKDAPPQS